MLPSDKTVSGNWICGQPYRNTVQLKTWYWNSEYQCWQSIDHMGKISFNYSHTEMYLAGWEIIEEEKEGNYTHDVTSIWGHRTSWNNETKTMDLVI